MTPLEEQQAIDKLTEILEYIKTNDPEGYRNSCKRHHNERINRTI